ncbi:unnamed protein product [Rhizoctonia solani]|uniref:Uncharacterized protein n=1 Tax=Rhizoctonia solani TaxID=456999 RepID=A0A8H2WM06_9AGAM|nr:unnamed protein product [Rhizoctonia solani]
MPCSALFKMRYTAPKRCKFLPLQSTTALYLLMLFYVLFLALTALILGVQADPTINTPASLVQCQPALITWSAVNSPIWLSIIPGGNPGATPIADFGKLSGTSFTWIVDIPHGTSVTCQLRDAAGAVAYSAPLTIQTSPDSSCIHKQRLM